jgi:hypothetical protein
MTRPAPLLALLLGCAQAPAQNNQSASPPAAPGANAGQQVLQPDPVMRPEVTQAALMARIEREVRLPPGAGALATYARYYAWRDGKDGRKVVAVWQNLTGERPGRHWVTERDFPVIMDGGCGVVSLTWDVATARIEQVACNGYA